MDEAIEALWIILSRPDDKGRGYADVDGIDALAELCAHLAHAAYALSDYFRGFHDNPDDRMTLDELKAVTIVADIADAIELTAERPKTGTGRGK